jgi:glutaredoxin-like protein NrdH
MPCRATKRHLNKLGLDFADVDITESETAQRYVESLGYTSVPVVVAGENHWTGYSPTRLDALK